MKAAIIGASEESLHTIEKAKKQGLKIVALDGNPSAAGLKLADQGIVCDISNEEETISVLKAEHPDFLLTVPIGRYLTTTGAVNDALHLKGISKANATVCTDKWIFHETLKEKGLRHCNAYLATENLKERNSLYKSISEQNKIIHFPAILKPRYGSGSRGIFFINHLEELKKALTDSCGEDYILEECIDGMEYGMDAAISNGQFHLILLRKKENTPLPNRQAVAYFSVLTDHPFYKEVKLFMEKVVKVLNLNNCLLHADLIQSEKGPFLIEMSARPSGHNLHNLFTPLCTAVDPAEEYIKFSMGKAYSFYPEQTKQMMIHYFDFSGSVRSVPSKAQIEKSLNVRPVIWQCNIQPGDILSAVKDGHSLMNRGFFVLEEQDESRLKEQAAAIKNLFEFDQR